MTHGLRLTFWTGFWVFLLDQATKYLVVHMLDLINRQRIDVFSPYLDFVMAWNRGVNFGLFASFDLKWVLIIVAIAISAAVLWWLSRINATKWAYISGGLLVGGAIGNVVDRLLYGAVADFINMSCCGIRNPFAFNIADVAIFAGAIGLAIWGEDQNAKPRKTKQ